MGQILLKPEEIKVERINTSVLHETLGTTFGERFLGVSTGPEGMTYHFKDDAGEADKNLILTAIAAHDTEALTLQQRQQKAVAEAFARFVSTDFEALRGQPDYRSIGGVLDALADIQMLMLGTQQHGE